MSTPTKFVQVNAERFKEIKALLERADRERPDIKADPFLNRIFALFDGMLLRGVSQEKAAYMVACIFTQAFAARDTTEEA